MNDESLFLGVDVSKAHLDFALRIGNKYRNKRFANSQAGLSDAQQWLRRFDAASVPVCMEATGIYWELAAMTLSDAGHRVSVVNPALVMGFAYNGKGEQVRKHLGTSNTYTVYDEAGHWVGDHDSSGNALQQALWMDDLPVGLLANNNQLHYVQPDHLGTPRAVIEVARNVPVWNWDLKGEAFGNTAPDQNPDGDAQAFVFDMRFPGQRFDAATGMNYNYYRDSDPSIGRYLQSDPLGINDGPLTYAYVKNRPLDLFDTYGLAATFRGFNKEQESKLRAALAEAIATIKKCSGCTDCGEQGERKAYCIDDFTRFQIAGLLESTSVSYVPDSPHAIGLCGLHTGGGTMQLTPSAFTGKCCKLSSVLAHEAAHGLGLSHERIFYMELQCFGCNRFQK